MPHRVIRKSTPRAKGRQPTEAPVGLYAHLPFCRQQCSYCDFFMVLSPASMGRFSEALIREIKLTSPPAGGLRTVYFGGGTPSLLPIEALTRVLGTIRKHLGPVVDSENQEPELTLEADPGDLTTDYLRQIRTLGVNRLSIGLQSLDDELLQLLGRCHDRDAGIQSHERARAAGFVNISLDLIYGLPGQSLGEWLDTLDRTVALEPDHLSCYELTFEPGTPIDRDRKAGRVQAPSAEQRTELFHTTSERLAEHGFEHYEISSFAREPRFRSRHNSSYWCHRPYLGLGPSAHGFDGEVRHWNHASLRRYLEDVEAGRLPVADRERLSEEQFADEAVLLGLRTTNGFDLSVLTETARQELEGLVTDGYLTLDDNRARPTRSGMAIADHLARQLTS